MATWFLALAPRNAVGAYSVLHRAISRNAAQDASFTTLYKRLFDTVSYYLIHFLRAVGAVLCS